MRVVGPSLLAFVLATSAGAQPLPVRGVTSPVTPTFFSAPDVGQASKAKLPPIDVEAEIWRLRAALSREVPGLASDIAEHEAEWIRRAQAALTAAGQAIDHPQLLVVVDSCPPTGSRPRWPGARWSWWTRPGHLDRKTRMRSAAGGGRDDIANSPTPHSLMGVGPWSRYRLI